MVFGACVNYTVHLILCIYIYVLLFKKAAYYGL